MVWRVNGITQGEVFAPAGVERSSYRIIEQSLKLSPGENNVIEIKAYNAKGLLATEPYRLEFSKFGERAGSRMHVLAVGVSDYARKDWRLNYAATDAKALGELLKAAAQRRGLYDDVKVSVVLDGEATAHGIEAAIDRMKIGVHAADVFVLYLAGHGRSVAGTYYFIPQDLVPGGGLTVMSHGIDQDKLQRWLARIPAQKSILILDTCESDTATRSVDIERETAVDRLRHATGRSIIAASSSAAYEGFQGHGLLTWTILDAFRKQDGGGDQVVEVVELVAHVDRQVPILSEKVFGFVQRPRNRFEGNSFPLGARLENLSVAPAAGAFPGPPTHVLIRAERVRKRPTADAPGARELSPGAGVRVLEFAGDWALVAREGQTLGYVPAAALARPH